MRGSPTPGSPRPSIPESPKSQLVAGPGDSGALTRQIETLKSKLKVMERKRLNDREKILEMQEDNKKSIKLENIVKRLQLKLTPMHEEIQSLRAKVKELEAENIKLSDDYHKNDDAIEMAALDREMAEERSETLALELEALKKKFEDLELECEILREENSLLSSEEREGASGGDSGAVLRLEKRNEQLEAALVKLREVYNSQEGTLKETQAALEQEQTNSNTQAINYQQASKKLTDAEAVVNDLRIQLDNALGAEDMIESLTEKNLELSEKCERLQRTIDELETLKELNDELEANTVYREKQLTTEIDNLESAKSEVTSKLKEYEDRNTYLESAILKFRDLVQTLNNEIDTLKAGKEETEVSNTLHAQTKAIDDLNLDIHSKSIVKTMDLELRKFESQQAINHLGIIKCYLPDEYSSDEQSIEALLRIERIAFQTDLMVSYFEDRIPVENITLNAKICIVLLEIKGVVCVIAEAMKRSNPQQFQKYSSLFEKVDEVATRLRKHIEDLRQEDIREYEVLKDLNSILLGLQKTNETYPGKKTSNFLTNNIQAYANLSLVVAKSLSATSNEEDQVKALEQEFSILSRTKVATKKLESQLQELNNQENTTEFCQSDLDIVKDIEQRCIGVVNFLVSFSTKLDDNNTNFGPCLTHLDKADGDDLIESIREYVKKLDRVSHITLNEVQHTQEIPPPWKVHAAKVSELKQVEKKQAEEIQALKDQEKKMAQELRSKDKTIEELNVKVGLLDSRLSKAKDNDKTVAELKKSLEHSTAQETSLQETITALKQKLTEQSTKLEKYQKESSEPIKAPEGKIMIAADASVISLQQQVESLRKTVGYLSRTSTSNDLACLKPISYHSGKTRSLVQRYCRTLFRDIRRAVSEFDLIKIQQPQPSQTLWKPRSKSNHPKVYRQIESLENIRDQIHNIASSCLTYNV
jgi:dynactin 1